MFLESSTRRMPRLSEAIHAQLVGSFLKLKLLDRFRNQVVVIDQRFVGAKKFIVNKVGRFRLHIGELGFGQEQVRRCSIESGLPKAQDTQRPGLP